MYETTEISEKIKIFMCCHKSFDIVPPLCIPVQGGAVLNSPIKGAFADIGENGSISKKNREYCELTVQYYAWKNISANYFGFCHYRRFFCFDENVKKPYVAIKNLSQKQQKSYFKTPEEIAELIERYEIITPRSEDMGINAAKYYCDSKYHFKEDLELFYTIIKDKFPQLKSTAREYLMQNKQYFCNMFIMKRELFEEYCDMLFPLLEEFDQYKKHHGNFQADRTDGYLGERFAGIFFTYAQSRGVLINELARIDIGCSTRKRLTYTILPPESKRRAFVKKFIKKNK